jgi:hypothetical protein
VARCRLVWIGFQPNDQAFAGIAFLAVIYLVFFAVPTTLILIAAAAGKIALGAHHSEPAGPCFERVLRGGEPLGQSSWSDPALGLDTGGQCTDEVASAHRPPLRQRQGRSAQPDENLA